MAIIPGGFFRCECGKIHMLSVLANVCPKCGLDLRYYQWKSGMDRTAKNRVAQGFSASA